LIAGHLVKGISRSSVMREEICKYFDACEGIVDASLDIYLSATISIISHLAKLTAVEGEPSMWVTGAYALGIDIDRQLSPNRPRCHTNLRLRSAGALLRNACSPKNDA
jgi:hypothetical protein